MAQKQLVSATNCQTATHPPAKADFLATSAEYRDDVRITTGYCSATAHNQLTHTKPEIVVVGADPHASGEGSATLSADEIRKHPQIVLGPAGANLP